uniref:Uncharacterized protein n=1 Tax=Grammatophora oceanica TaxID=210454 RepID=A0A7S1UTI3_9STRA|mmetsp:Transcript_22173/g.32983  ORF Transcript_22173/g.32983 Transcript_22173/m.32983 type:complete len:107 (+) Transcript_22173:957-1277(+)
MMTYLAEGSEVTKEGGKLRRRVGESIEATTGEGVVSYIFIFVSGAWMFRPKGNTKSQGMKHVGTNKMGAILLQFARFKKHSRQERDPVEGDNQMPSRSKPIQTATE